MLLTTHYMDQARLLPASGRHILAQADASTIIVYQAYRPSIAAYALAHGRFGGEFKYSRMSWIKTNFLWMMYRSGWGMKPGQEVTLAIRISLEFFDSLLAQAVESSFPSRQFSSREEWQRAVRDSTVRLQWDPDHHPNGPSLQRRALQLGLRGKSLEDFGKREILEILDISPFVAEQRQNIGKRHIAELMVPVEGVYIPAQTSIGIRLGLD